MKDNSLELKLISQLMDQLHDEMQYGEDDFASRLGRKKPDLEVVKIEGDLGPEGLEKSEEMAGKDFDGDMEMGESPEHAAMMMDKGEMDPAEELKKRLMKMRG